MIRQYYTLQHIVKELQAFIGMQVSECFSQEKDSISIVFSNGEDEHLLHFAADGVYDSLYIRENFKRARSNTFDKFPDLVDEVLQKAELVENNRIIVLKFMHTIAYIILFGGKKSNLLLKGGNGLIFDAMNDPKQLKGQKYTYPENFLKKIEDFPAETQIIKALAGANYMLGRQYAREILSQINIEDSKKLSEISDNEIQLIKKSTSDFISELQNTKQYYLLKNGDKCVFSLYPLSHYPEVIGEYDTPSKAIKRANSFNYKQSDFMPLFNTLKKRLEKLSVKLDKKINSIDISAYEKRLEKYKLYAELLAAYAEPQKTKIESLFLLDYSDIEVEIPLDSKKNIIENSAKYYEKIKKSKKDLKVRLAMLPKFKEELKQVNISLEELANTSDLKQLERLYKKYGKELKINYQDNKMDREDKFRKFELEGGLLLYVGKNSKNNDELTMKFARPNDIWLHARGSSGSHAVLRVEKGQKVSKRIIEKAGEICAYYSGSKNAKYTPVAYTEKKYVRKPKGAAQGAVVIAREKVVMVEPRLPE